MPDENLERLQVRTYKVAVKNDENVLTKRRLVTDKN